MSNDIHVRNNESLSQFEAQVDGHLAVAQYRLIGDHITFTHTEVPEELQGQGIAGRLARTALEHARAEGLKVIPRCPYIAGYIRKHPEYQDLVQQD